MTTGSQATYDDAALDDLPWLQPVRRYLVVQEQFDDPRTLAATEDADGTRRLQVPLPPPLLEHSELARRKDLRWHVDVAWSGSTGVRYRGLDARTLLGTAEPVTPIWVRASRAGLSYAAQPHGPISRGVIVANTVARPRVIDLSLSAWVAAKAAEHGLLVRPSAPGQRSRLLARKLGSRQSFVDLFSGPLLEPLRALARSTASADDSFPAGDGYALGRGESVGELRLFRRLTTVSATDLRAEVDRVVDAGVLRRGLVLRCSECATDQFLTVDQVRQQWVCQRCDAAVPLDATTWRPATSEPTWYYDLHPAGRQLLTEHGDVSALLATHLKESNRSTAEGFASVEEVELLQDGSLVAELDLISHGRNVLAVAECKSGTAIEVDWPKTRESVLKRCRAAAVLDADVLIFATTAPEWSPKTLDHIDTAVRQFPGWSPRGRPEVRIISGLGGAVQSETLTALRERNQERMKRSTPTDV